MPRNKESMKWLCVCCGVLFLAISSFIRVIEVFPSGNDGSFMVLLAIASALLTLGLAIASFPRWQSFFGFLVFIYAIYWFFFTASYAVA
jgi:hypothetical protein